MLHYYLSAIFIYNIASRPIYCLDFKDGPPQHLRRKGVDLGRYVSGLVIHSALDEKVSVFGRGLTLAHR